MVRRMLALMLAALMLSLCGCAVTPAPEKALDRMLDALQQGNIRAAQSHTAEGTLNIQRSGRNAERIYGPLFASLVYSVTGSQTSGDSAVVTVTISVVDMEELTTRVTATLLQEVLTQNLSQRQASDRYYSLLLEQLESDSAPTASYTVAVQMTRTGRSWKVDLAASPAFAEAITGGLPSILGY